MAYERHCQHDDGRGHRDADGDEDGAGTWSTPCRPELPGVRVRVRVPVRSRAWDRGPQLELQPVEVVGHCPYMTSAPGL